MARSAPQAEYDPIAERYAAANAGRPLFGEGIYPFFLSALGDLTGQAVLDLGCGDGEITEKILEYGARSVRGIDAAPEMIRIARRREYGASGRIEYEVGKVGELKEPGRHDLVTGAFLLHYAATKDELCRMCGDIAARLNPQGRFVGIINNPGHPLNPDPRYGNTIRAVREFPLEGDTLFVEGRGGNNEVFQFVNYYWKKETYEWALLENGLTCRWKSIIPPRAAFEKTGEAFWRPFLERPFFIMMECKPC